MAESDHSTTNESTDVPGSASGSVALDTDPSVAGLNVEGSDLLQPGSAAFRRRGRNFALWVVAGTLSLVGIIGFFVETDYVALMPGSARDTEPLLEVEGTQSFPNDGEILFTTVRVRQDINIWEYLWRKLDDDVRLVHEDVILQGRSSDENRTVNLQAMVDSKTIAIAVALEALGYETIEPDGVFISEVIEGSAADGVLEAGDILRTVDGIALLQSSELVEVLSGKVPGDEVVLLVEPMEGEVEERTVVLGSKEDDASAAFLGVAPQTLVNFEDPDVGFEVDIDSGSVGGPSAGLAFTLAIIDQLTAEELTAGTRVAVTGTMSVDGSVGPVGGVPQKAAAVRDLGIEYFIVPRSLGEETLAQLEDVVADEVAIIPVDSLEEALEVLSGIRADN